MSTRKLVLERGCESAIRPGERTCMNWFHELPGKNGRYHEAERAEICAEGMNNYVTVGERVRYITIVARKHETADCFDLRYDGRIKEVNNYIDADFQAWLRASYNKGYRFIDLEIGK